MSTMNTETTISFTAAIGIFESSVGSYNWITSLPDPHVQNIPRHNPTINEVHHAVAALREMAVTMETAAELKEYPDTEDDSSFVGHSSLALRYVPTINDRSPSRVERLKRWVRSKIRGSSRA